MIYDRFNIKKFVDDFFDYRELNDYEGYDLNNILIYFNIIEKVPNNELYRIFFIENKICKLNNEKKYIKYDKSNNMLTLIKHNSEKEKQIKCHINTFYIFFNILNQNKNKKIDQNGNINKIISISKVITTKSQLNFLINGLSKVIERKDLKFQLIYKAISDKSKINQINDIIGKNRYLSFLVKINKGSILGAYTYFYDYYNKYMNINTDENELGIVFNFIDKKIYYNVEGFVYKDNKGIEIKDYFYILKPSFRLKNKIMYDLIEIGERYFTCKIIEFYEIY